MTQETLEDIAKWVIEFRITKNEYARVSDFEMYHTIIEKVSKWQQERSYSEENMRKAFCAGFASNVTSSINDAFEKWFEKFKNK